MIRTKNTFFGMEQVMFLEIILKNCVKKRGFAVADEIAYAGDLAGTFYAFGMGPTTTDLSVTGTNLVIGETIAVDGKVFDESPSSPGAPIVNVPVNILEQKMGDSTWTTLEPATTYSMGRFVTQWTPTAEGTYKLKANFVGTDDYGWSSAEVTMQVRTPTSIPISISAPMTDIYLAGSTIAIIAAIAVVGFLILRKK